MSFHEPNVVICGIITGKYWTLIVGAYLPPSMLAHLLDLEKDLAHFQGQEPIMLGDLDMDLDETQNRTSSSLPTC